MNSRLQKALKKFTKCDKLRLKLMMINRNRPRYVRLLSKLKLDCWVIADDLSDFKSEIKSEKFSRTKIKMVILARKNIQFLNLMEKWKSSFFCFPSLPLLIVTMIRAMHRVTVGITTGAIWLISSANDVQKQRIGMTRVLAKKWPAPISMIFDHYTKFDLSRKNFWVFFP